MRTTRIALAATVLLLAPAAAAEENYESWPLLNADLPRLAAAA